MNKANRMIISEMERASRLMEAFGVCQVMREPGSGGWIPDNILNGKSLDYIAGYYEGMSRALEIIKELSEGDDQKDEVPV